MNKTFIFFALVSCIQLQGTARAQSFVEVSPCHYKCSFKSERLKLPLSIWVKVPDGYQDSEAKFGGIYYLDASFAQELMDAMLPQLTIPKVITVGIDLEVEQREKRRELRSYLLTPVVDPENGNTAKTTGGGPLFQRCVEDEIIPMVEEQFRIDRNNRTLMGGSYGGLFCLYSLLENPGLFKNVVALSPPVHFHENYLSDLESEIAKTHRTLPVNLFIAVGSRETTELLDGVREFVAQVKETAYEGLRLKSVIFENETHASLPRVGFGEGLRWIYEK